jgi:hypothetical protein
MRCGRCGEENPERARFSLACGASLEAEPGKQHAPPLERAHPFRRRSPARAERPGGEERIASAGIQVLAQGAELF